MAKGQGGPNPYERLTPEWRQMLVEEMERRGLSNRALARRVGVSNGTISNLRTGKHPGAPAAEKVAEYLGLPPPGFHTLDEWRLIQELRELREDDPAGYLEVVERVHRIRSRQKNS